MWFLGPLDPLPPPKVAQVTFEPVKQPHWVSTDHADPAYQDGSTIPVGKYALYIIHIS